MSTACKITQSNTCNTFTRSLSTLSQRKTRRTGRHVCLSALPVATLLSPSLRENITLFPILVLALSWKENLRASIEICRFYLYFFLDAKHYHIQQDCWHPNVQYIFHKSLFGFQHTSSLFQKRFYGLSPRQRWTWECVCWVVGLKHEALFD